MYCRYCGKKVVDDAVFCSHCGRALYENCSSSGNNFSEENYGSNSENSYDETSDSKVKRRHSDHEGVITLLLCIFFGVLGAHRFYTGRIASGIIQLLTLGGCGIWSLIDFILILVGSFKDSDGNAIVI